MREVILFTACCGPNAKKGIIEETVTTVIKCIGIEDFSWYWAVDKKDLQDFILQIIPSKNVADVVVSNKRWCEQYSDFFERYKNDFRYMLYTQDDIIVNTPNFYPITMKEIEGHEDEIAWITYTNKQFHQGSKYGSNSSREGTAPDRNNWPSVFECHGGGQSLDFPERAVKVFGPYTHMNLISTKAMEDIGPPANFGSYVTLLDEDWCLTSLIKNYTNVWVPSVEYFHPNPHFAHLRVLDLRETSICHPKFRQKWNAEPPYTDAEVAYLMNKYKGTKLEEISKIKTYDWQYLK